MPQDFAALLINTQTPQEIVIKYAGQDWKFKMRELPYTVITRIGSQCVNIVNGKATIDKSEYDVRYLEEALIEAPWEDLKLTRKIMGTMKKDFGVLLCNYIQQPFDVGDDDLKKA
jgi:hypothetical protein